MSVESALSHDDTRMMAHRSIQPHVQRLEQLVLEHLQIFGPSTSDEVEQRLDMAHQTISARLTALHAKGLVITCGQRKTRSGRQARLYRVRGAEA